MKKNFDPCEIYDDTASEDDCGDYGSSRASRNAGRSGRGGSAERILIAYCDCCGLPVYQTDGALSVDTNGDVIHSECWESYAADNAALFTHSAEIPAER